MKHKKIVILALTISIAVMIFGGISTVSAQSTDDTARLVAEDVETRGLFVSVSVSLNGDGNGLVIATAKNEFTLGTTTLAVKVELYSSETKPIDVSEMDLVTGSYIEDLNIFKSITAKAYTGGKAKYWCATVMYNKDNTGWKYDNTEIVHYDANANVIN